MEEKKFMKYVGSKRLLAKHLLPIILKDRKSDQYYVEPFVGGANMIDKVDGKRIGSDINNYLIALFKALQNGWMPPKEVTEEEYKNIKDNKEKFPDYLVGYVGFNLSFGAKWFGGYGRDKKEKRNYSLEAYNFVNKQIPLLKDIKFICSSYKDLIIPPESIIYCDPPYVNTIKYKDNIDHDEFWEWANKKVIEGHNVFVSEQIAPENWKIIYEKEAKTCISRTVPRIERLFTNVLTSP